MAKIFIGINTTGWLSVHMARWLLAQTSLDIGPGKPIEGITFHLENAQPQDAAANKVMDAFLKTDCTHIMKLDDDIMCDMQLIPRLLSYDKDVVGSAVTVCQEGGVLYCGAWIEENGSWKAPDIRPPNNVLVGPIDFVGGGCVLIKREVIEALKKEYGKVYHTEYNEDGQVKTYCDNMLFSRVKKLGFKSYLDGTQILGQVCEINLIQALNPGTWPRES